MAARTPALAAALLACLATPARAQSPLPEVTNLVLMIVDGGGIGFWSAARFAVDELAVADMPVVGLVDTRTHDGRITDSAAGATAYATGHRTWNGALAVGPECRERRARDPEAECAPLETLLEQAEARGRATGLVTTTAVTDATPAAFAAHVPRRSMQGPIARQLLASGVDVLLGGGRIVFDGSAGLSEGNLLTPACRSADCPADGAELAALPLRERRLIGLFAPLGMEAAGRRAPDRPTMTLAALGRLSLDPDGFFLMVETEGTDETSHANDTLAAAIAEIVQFDRAVRVVLDFAARTPGTLVVVTADHETGGFALQEEGGTLTARYTTGNHTGALVPLFARGPGAELLGGIKENREVGRILRELMAR